MSQLGFGVLINMLMGPSDKTSTKLQECLGKTITKLDMVEADRENHLHFEFADGTTLQIRDDGQSCCEHRYMTTDDDLPYYVGAELTSMELAPGPDAEDEYGECHEQQFLRVGTSKGVFTVVTHNEHNGYYGGFYIIAE